MTQVVGHLKNGLGTGWCFPGSASGGGVHLFRSGEVEYFRSQLDSAIRFLGERGWLAMAIVSQEASEKLIAKVYQKVQ